jgi:hypothetical protein
MSEDFDRSFDFFQSKVDAEENKVQQIWNQDNSWIINETSLDTSFEGDMFEFSAAKSNPDSKDQTTVRKNVLFPADPFVKEQQQQNVEEKGAVSVQFAISEQVSAMYDDFSQEGAISVTGSIHMKPTEKIKSTICLVLKEVSTNVLRLDHVESTCEDISEVAYENGLNPSDKVLRINIKPNVDEDRWYVQNS